MECSAENLAHLDELHALDFAILNLQRTFDQLPQRAAILKARRSLEDLRTRKESADALVARAQAKVDGVLEEDARLSEKQAGIEAVLKEKATGYRDVEARNKELAGVAKRRETLNHLLVGHEAELAKAQAVAKKVDATLAQVEAAEAAQVASFKKQGTELLERIAATKAKRAQFAPTLAPDVLAEYEKAVARCGGVGLAHLQGATCSVCRATIDEARLHQLKRDAPLGSCPLCRRLIVIDGE